MQKAWLIATALGLGCATQSDATRTGKTNMKMQSHVSGEGSPALVLVGGGLTGSLSWEPFQPGLAKTRRVARLQPLAVQYGLENRALPAGYSVNMESDALAAAVDDLTTEPIHLVAWSYGAAIALDFALDHPTRIRSLTLIEPPAFWVLDATATRDPELARDIEELRALYASMVDDVSEAQLATFVCHVGLCPPGARPQQLPPWPVWVQHRRSLRGGSAPWEHHDTAERLRAFDRPVLLVTGRGTAPFLRRITDALASVLPRARVVELAGGHAPQIVDKDRFLDALESFISGSAPNVSRVSGS
jgi:pimeloyl-ACP methyl ester carboxylesterase